MYIERAIASPEAQLLIGCSRRELDDGARKRILTALQCEPDWASVIALADGNAVLPLLHRHLTALPAGTVPQLVLIELWGRQEITARRNRAMTEELIDILAVLDANGIAAIPYKGPALAQFLHGDTALREFGDLDILVRLRDLHAAKALLESRGYEPGYPLDPEQESAFLRSPLQYHLVLEHPSRGMVELHWKTDMDFPVERDDDAWWNALATTPLGDARVRSFSPEELLLVLCLHGSKHYWNCLGWVADVADLVRGEPHLDWARVAGEAARMRCTRRIDLGLYLAQRLLDAPLPPQVRAAIEGNTVVGALAAKSARNLFTPGADGLGTLAALRFNLDLYETAAHRVRYVFATIFAPSLVELTRWRLPRALHFLYAPLRLARLSWKYLHR